MRRIFLLVFTACLLLVQAACYAAQVTDVKWGVDKNNILRLVVDLTDAAGYHVDVTDASVNLTVDAGISALAAGSRKMKSDVADVMQVAASGGKTIISLPLKVQLTPGDCKAFTLKKDPVTGRPARIVLDLATPKNAQPLPPAKSAASVARAPQRTYPAPSAKAGAQPPAASGKAGVSTQPPRVSTRPPAPRHETKRNIALAQGVNTQDGSGVRPAEAEKPYKAVEDMQARINAKALEQQQKREQQQAAQAPKQEPAKAAGDAQGQQAAGATAQPPATAGATAQPPATAGAAQTQPQAASTPAAQAKQPPAQEAPTVQKEDKNKAATSVRAKKKRSKKDALESAGGIKARAASKKRGKKDEVVKGSGKFRVDGGIAGKIITLDAGHGGSDPGAIGPSGLKEKEITLAIARLLEEELEKKGAKVFMTRTRDVDVYGPNASDVQELQARVNVGERNNSDIFVSLHINSSVNKNVGGFSTYYFPKTANDLRLAQAVQKQLTANFGVADMGVRQANFYVIKRISMPAVLLEMCFISNPEEEKLMQGKWFQKKAAKMVAEGLEKYFK